MPISTVDHYSPTVFDSDSQWPFKTEGCLSLVVLCLTSAMNSESQFIVLVLTTQMLSGNHPLQQRKGVMGSLLVAALPISIYMGSGAREVVQLVRSLHPANQNSIPTIPHCVLCVLPGVISEYRPKETLEHHWV